VDPEPFRFWASLLASKRDLIIGLGLGEIATFIDDGQTKERVTEATQDLTQKAADRLAAPSSAESKGRR
jgi:hypothetical protein